MKRFHIVESCTECGFFRKGHGFNFMCAHPKVEACVYEAKTYKAQAVQKVAQFKRCPLGIMMETDAL